MASKKRLIDADALAELLDMEYRRKMKLVQKGEGHLDTLAEGIMAMSVVLGTMPTVDAVEVVRCEKCKHAIWDEGNEMWKCVESAEYDEKSGEWFGFYEFHNGDFFCAHGKESK